MVHKRFIFVTCLMASAFAVANAGSVRGQELNFKIEDYVKTDLTTIRASIDKANLAARAYVANPSNKTAELLGSDFFKKIVQKPYPLSGGGTLTVEKMGIAGPIVPAMIFATAMREVEKGEMDDTKLQTAWLTKQNELLKAMNGKPTAQNPTPIFQVKEEQAWRQFLIEWTQAATDKGSLRKGLQEAPYELVKAMVERFDGEIESAKAGPGGSSFDASGMSSGTVSSGGYFPLHERLMNHIYRHNDRRMNKVERIRARR